MLLPNTPVASVWYHAREHPLPHYQRYYRLTFNFPVYDDRVDDHLFPSDHPLLVPLMRLCDEMFGTQIVDNGPDRNTERGDMLVTLSQAAAMIFVQYESEHLFRRLKTSFSERNDLLYRVVCIKPTYLILI